MLLNSSTRAAKLQYSQHEYWVEVALRVDGNDTCTRRKWYFGVGKSGTCTPKNYIFVVFKANSEGENVLSTMLFSPEWVFRSRVLEQYLHCKLRGWRKVFYNKFDER